MNTKIQRAIKLIQSVKCDCIEVSYSGGKDSDVILELTKMAGVNYRAIYKNTTIDPTGTIQHCRKNGVEIMPPKKSFYKVIEERGFPTRRARFCCEVLKEYKVLDNAIQGIRRCESVNREKLYKEPIICRIYGKKENHVNVVLPILDWSDKDVEVFIKQRGIECHNLYYCNNKFDVTQRLGCLACPMVSDNGLKDFKANPKLVKAWINAGSVWWNKPRKKEIRSKKNFCNIYELFVHNVFFNSYDDFKMAISGMFGEIDCKEFLENYFNISL